MNTLFGGGGGGAFQNLDSLLSKKRLSVTTKKFNGTWVFGLREPLGMRIFGHIQHVFVNMTEKAEDPKRFPEKKTWKRQATKNRMVLSLC